MSKEQCVNCGSEVIRDHGEAENERPNGDKMRVYECEDCGQLWKE